MKKQKYQILNLKKTQLNFDNNLINLKLTHFMLRNDFISNENESKFDRKISITEVLVNSKLF